MNRLNRPLRYFVIGIGIAIVFGVVKAFSEEEKPGAKLRADYDKCVGYSLGIQMRSPSGTDANSMTEKAFNSCLTEESAIRHFLVVQDMDAQTIDAAILRIKLEAKAAAREYVRRHGL